MWTGNWHALHPMHENRLHRVLDSYCFSTSEIITRKPLSGRLHVHCLSCLQMSVFCYRQCDASGVGLSTWEASGVLLHKLVGVPSRYGQVLASEHQPLSLHAPHIRIWRSDEGEQSETLRQVSGHRARWVTSATFWPLHAFNIDTYRYMSVLPRTGLFTLSISIHIDTCLFNTVYIVHC